MKRSATLRTRLVLSHLAVAIVSILLISAFAATAIYNSARREVEQDLETLTFAGANALEKPLAELRAGNTDIEAARKPIEQLLAGVPGIGYIIFHADGTPMQFDSKAQIARGEIVPGPEIQEALQNSTGAVTIIHQGPGGEWRLYSAARIEGADGIQGVLRLDAPALAILETARDPLLLLFAAAVLGVLGVGIFGWLLAKNLTRPIQDLTQTATRLAEGDLTARVNPAGPYEFHRLAMAINIMAGRLQDHVDELRAFVANASHELRTPLTVVKLRTEALRNGALEDLHVSEQFLGEIEGEVDRLSCMVSDLLDLSRMEAGLAPNQRNLMNLGLLAGEVSETFSIRAAKAGLGLEKSIENNLPSITGNEEQLRRVLYNLIDNAIKYTPRGGSVRVHVSAGRSRKTVRLVVQDNGPGIAAEHLAHVFERFYRVEATRPRYGSTKGSGLGLAIARSIIENHSGRIGVTSQLGKGTTFWVELPAQT